MKPPAAHLERRAQAQQALRARAGGQDGAPRGAQDDAQDGGPRAAPLGLDKATSNLFRHRAHRRKQRLDLRAFDQVLEIDALQARAQVEGLVPYETLVAATLPQGFMPAVVPQLKTITVGGAAAGVGIEATSFRRGLVHHGLHALDVLLPEGEVVECRPDNAHADLFFGFANSYGTLGYALRLEIALVPVKPWVRVQHTRHADAGLFFADLAQRCAGDADFVDGVVFDERTLVISEARFVDHGPAPSDYTFERMYYRSLLEREVDHLSAAGYLWRWDTDWFWCSRQFHADQAWVRRLLGREHLNSRTYTRLMRWNARWGLTARLARWQGRHPESVVQDVDIPLDRAAEFLEFLHARIGIRPVWICPLRVPAGAGEFPLFPLRRDTLYVNFGFWDVVDSPAPHPPGHFNRLVEDEVLRLGGLKSLYSDSFFDRETFDRTYAADAYQRLKARYDPHGRLLGLYEKCVLRA